MTGSVTWRTGSVTDDVEDGSHCHPKMGDNENRPNVITVKQNLPGSQKSVEYPYQAL